MFRCLSTHLKVIGPDLLDQETFLLLRDINQSLMFMRLLHLLNEVLRSYRIKFGGVIYLNEP